LENGLERTAFKVGTKPVIEEADDAHSGDRRLDSEIHCGGNAHEQWPHGFDSNDLPCALELPWRHRATAETSTYARVLEEVARMLGTTAAVEVGRGRCGREFPVVLPLR